MPEVHFGRGRGMAHCWFGLRSSLAEKNSRVYRPRRISSHSSASSSFMQPPSGLTGIELTGSEGGAGALPPRAESVHEPLIHLTPEASTADELDALASSSQMGRSEQVDALHKHCITGSYLWDLTTC